jgi:hypothetical protein
MFFQANESDLEIAEVMVDLSGLKREPDWCKATSSTTHFSFSSVTM